MKDILQQMIVTTGNGEKVLFFDLRGKVAKDGMREAAEAARMDNLMKLAVSVHEEGPMQVTSVSVGRTS